MLITEDITTAAGVTIAAGVLVVARVPLLSTLTFVWKQKKLSYIALTFIVLFNVKRKKIYKKKNAKQGDKKSQKRWKQKIKKVCGTSWLASPRVGLEVS